MKIKELTSFIMHKHYCENDVEAIIEQMDDDILWIGAADHEYTFGFDTVSNIFRKFAGKVPKYNITDEEYQVLEISPDVFL